MLVWDCFDCDFVPASPIYTGDPTLVSERPVPPPGQVVCGDLTAEIDEEGYVWAYSPGIAGRLGRIMVELGKGMFCGKIHGEIWEFFPS